MNKTLNNQQIKIIFDIAIKAGEMAIEGFYQKNFQIFENGPVHYNYALRSNHDLF